MTKPIKKRSKTDRSKAGKLLVQLQSGRDQRKTKVRRIRAAIEAKHYENNLKLQIAIDRLLGEIA
jgi:hypothetical protein